MKVIITIEIDGAVVESLGITPATPTATGQASLDDFPLDPPFTGKRKQRSDVGKNHHCSNCGEPAGRQQSIEHQQTASAFNAGRGTIEPK